MATTVKHSSTYNLCVNMIRVGNTEGLADKLDVFLLANRVTQVEYEELMTKINPAE